MLKTLIQFPFLYLLIEDTLPIIFNLNEITVLNLHTLFRLMIIDRVAIDADVFLKVAIELFLLLKAILLVFDGLHILSRRFDLSNDLVQQKHFLVSHLKKLVVAEDEEVALFVFAHVFD